MASKVFGAPARCKNCGIEFTLKEWGRPWKCIENLYSCQQCAREQRKINVEKEKLHVKKELQDKAIELERIKTKQKRYEMKSLKYKAIISSGKKMPPRQPVNLSNNSTSSISTFTTLSSTDSNDSDFEDDENCADDDVEQ